MTQHYRPGRWTGERGRRSGCKFEAVDVEEEEISLLLVQSCSDQILNAVRGDLPLYPQADLKDQLVSSIGAVARSTAKQCETGNLQVLRFEVNKTNRLKLECLTASTS